MDKQEVQFKPLGDRWYVMVHLSPQWIDSMLERESRGELLTTEQQEEGYPLEPFEYYVPYLYMRPDVSDDIRRIFHHFVFVRASKKRIQEIVASDWNTRTRLPLTHYRNRAGTEITISDREFQQLRDVIYNRQLKIFFGIPTPSVRKMEVGNKVLLNKKNWENHPGVIESIRLKKNGISIRVTFNFLGRTKYITFDDLHDGDVIFADNNTEQLISGKLIQNFEKEILSVLGHWFKKGQTEKKLHEILRLRRLYAYADIQIDEEDDRKRFTALMLICARLLALNASERFESQLQQWLDESAMSDEPQGENAKNRQCPMPRNDTDAYMMLALFISNRDPRLRDAVKAYHKASPTSPAVLGSFINKVRDIRTARRPRA